MTVPDDLMSRIFPSYISSVCHPVCMSLITGHKRIFPKSFVNPDIYEHFAKDYMFLGCIKYINQVRGLV